MDQIQANAGQEGNLGEAQEFDIPMELDAPVAEQGANEDSKVEIPGSQESTLEVEDNEGKPLDGAVEDNVLSIDEPEVATPEDVVDWTQTLNLLGVQVEEPTTEKILAALEEKIITEKHPYLKEFNDSPEGKAMLDYMKNGGTREGYFDVTSQYNEVLSMDDNSIVLALLQNTVPETAQQEFDKLTPEQLKAEALRIRTAVGEKKAEAISNMVEESKANHEKYKEQVKAEMRINDKAVTDQIMSLEKIFEMPLTPELKKSIAEKWNNGEYKKQFAEDPSFVAKLVATHATAEATMKRMLENISKAGHESAEKQRKLVLQYLHNFPRKKEAVVSKDTVKDPNADPMKGFDPNKLDGPVEFEYIKM